jgi:hypothetical protein
MDEMEFASDIGQPIEVSEYWRRQDLGRQRAQAEQEKYAQAHTDRQSRLQALEAALRTVPIGKDFNFVLEAARAYEAYLKGE